MSVENDDWELEEYKERLSSLEEVDSVLLTDFGTEVFPATWDSLHAYQKEGCKWMYRLYQTGVGGILGDEMGTVLTYFKLQVS
jgi:SNF2 family DNA or RNA helicase